MARNVSIFFSGWLAHVGITMMRQDMMGIEKYIQHCRLQWVELSPMWGLGIAVFAAYLGLRNQTQAGNSRGR